MSFDPLAPYYRAMEWMLAGNKLQRCRIEWIHEARNCRRALVVGEGPGRFLEVFVRRFPDVEILCVDASGKMLAKAREAVQRRVPNHPRVEFLKAELPEWKPAAEGFDLIVTHFFLDCFPPELLKRVVGALGAGAKPGALWLMADFCEPSGWFLRRRARLILRLAYAFFRMTTRLPAGSLTKPDGFLEENGFMLRQRRFYDAGLLHSDLWIKNPKT